MRTVASAMTSVPILDASTTLQDASAAMLDAHVEAAVVVDNAKIQGLLMAGDVADAMAQGRDVGTTPVLAVASRDPTLVKKQEPLAIAHERMRMTEDSPAVVIDDDGNPVGVLAHDGGAI